jgi:uncharacterized protein
MFHTILTLSYVIPNVYLFVRIWQLFIARGYMIRYTLIYLIFASVYPLSNIIPHDNHGFFTGFLEMISGYLLPFYLYIFLLVLSFDIFLLINLIFGLFPFDKLKTRQFRIKGLSVLVSVSAVVVIAGAINFNTIRTSDYSIEIPAGSSRLSSLKIAFASDFHLGENTNIRFVERFVRKIGEIGPEIMLFGGDIVEGDREDENMRKPEYLLRSIRTKYGVYGVLGNHEHYANQDKGSFFSKAGIEILSDSSIVFGNSFILTGRNDSHVRTRKSIDELMRSIPDSIPVILMDHRPNEIDQVSRTKTAIQLSGHTHNGQLFPINLITKKVYKLSRGYRKFGRTHFFVSSGIRLWGPPVRTAGKSEIIVLNVTFTQ